MQTLYLGSYTRRESQGIYTLDWNFETGTLDNLNLIIKEGNPTYLGLTDNNTLVTVTARDNMGGVASYRKDDNGEFKEINHVLLEGAAPCYVGIDNHRQLVYGANYHKGEVTVYHIDETGQLTLTDTVQHEGNGPHANQASAHAHYADLTPDNRLVVCDLGTDEVYTYDVSSKGKLTEVARLNVAPGTGPRHIVFHPEGKVAYILGELANTLTVVNYDEITGTFSEITTLSTLPSDFDGESAGGAIRISEDGRFVYVSNRGHNSVAVYQTQEEGHRVEKIQTIASEGDFPRDFTLSPDNNWVLVAHQNSDNITLFKRDAENGRLTLKETDILAPECVCTYFA